MSTARLFDEYYERYDSWFERNTVTAENEVRLVETVMEGAPKPIVEVGVGTGYFASKVNVDVGLDPSIKMLEVARMRGLELLVGGVGELAPFRDGSFGTVLIVVTLCFVDDPVSVLRESHRILRDNGVLVTCIIPRDSAWGAHYVELGLKGHIFYSKARFYTLNELKKMLETTGFRVVDVMGTLSYTPHDKPRVEEPSREVKGRSFICVKSIKSQTQSTTLS